MKQHIVNFSGGRTSAKLVLEIESLRKRGLFDGDVEYVFADTGAEHPKTYEFIRNFVEYSGINLTCLRADISSELGVGTTYKVISLNQIGYNLDVWREMLKAYSSPFNPGGGFCTDMLKSIPSDKYCDAHYGKGGYFKWIGYRADEAKRAWGHENYSALLSFGFNQDDCLELIKTCMAEDDHAKFIRLAIPDNIDAFDENKTSKRVEKLINKVSKIKKHGFRFMLEIDESEKPDVIRFWSKMPFDLEIDEHLGNCVFCIKKGDNKVELAARSEPEMASDWSALFNDKSVRDLGRRFPPNVIYRGHLSFEMVRMKYQGIDSNEIESRIKGAKINGTSSGCSESCSAFSNQIDMFD